MDRFSSVRSWSWTLVLLLTTVAYGLLDGATHRIAVCGCAFGSMRKLIVTHSRRTRSDRRTTRSVRCSSLLWWRSMMQVIPSIRRWSTWPVLWRHHVRVARILSGLISSSPARAFANGFGRRSASSRHASTSCTEDGRPNSRAATLCATSWNPKASPSSITIRRS